VRIDNVTVTEDSRELNGGELVQVGKRRFFKLEGR
jgi:hypothetical protein